MGAVMLPGACYVQLTGGPYWQPAAPIDGQRNAVYNPEYHFFSLLRRQINTRHGKNYVIYSL